MSKKKTTATTATKRNTRAAAKSAASKATEAKAEGKKSKLSLLSAAAAVLAESDEPLNCKRMIELAKERGLWTPGAGKTPEQTLYSAIMREIKDKGDAARFRKSPLRGHFLAQVSAS